MNKNSKVKKQCHCEERSDEAIFLNELRIMNHKSSKVKAQKPKLQVSAEGGSSSGGKS
jgi:hypothetical protein